MYWRRAVSLLAITVVLACSKDEKAATSRSAGEASSSGPASVDTTGTHAQAGHAAAALQPGPEPHATGAAAAPGGARHAQHAGAQAARAQAQAAHTVAGRADTTHSAHAQQRADTSHAAHVQAKPADSAHAAHVPPKPDTTHAAHAAPKPGDTTHAAHATPAGDTTHAQHQQAPGHAGHGMAMVSVGSGWMALGMAQAFPTITLAAPSEEGTPLDRRGVYVTQPALMFIVESPGSRVSLHTTLNLEGITQPGGELTFGGWGEGFIDKRHPHTYLHEAMLSLNLWRGEYSGFSVSAGKGFAPYGTDDPMMRPVIKYPTNHHLSQILERWTVNGVWTNGPWSLEAGLFGGAEPISPSDFSNIESFGDSWSARVTRRFGPAQMGTGAWELAGSFGSVAEEHNGETETTRLYNLALRHEHDHGAVHMYGLLEGSWSDPEEVKGYYSILGEGSLTIGAHKPYARVELATRPEYPRAGAPDTKGFFRYDHDEEAAAATRWLIVSAGYGYTATALPFSVRPYVEAQFNRVRPERGDIDPVALFGRSSFWSLSAGFRLFLGGDPMRMGSYGVLDPMTRMHRMQMQPTMSAGQQH